MEEINIDNINGDTIIPRSIEALKLIIKVLYNYKNELNIDSYQIKRNKEKPESIIIYTINNDNYITIYFDGDNNLIRGGRAVVAGFYPIFYETVYEFKNAINICLDHLVNTPDNY